MAFKIAEAFVDITIPVQQFERTLSRVRGRLSRFSQNLNSMLFGGQGRNAAGQYTGARGGLIGGAVAASGLGRYAGAAGVAAASYAAVRGVKSFASFQKAMGEVFVLLNTEGQEAFGDLTKFVEDLSMKTGKPVEDIAAGLFDIVSAGTQSVPKMKEMLAASAELSVGGFTDLATTTSALITLMAAYGDTVGNAAVGTDKLFKTAKVGRTNVQKLASVFGQFGGAASLAGVNLDQLLAVFASGTRLLNSEETATGLATFLKPFRNPSKEQIEIMRKLGYEMNSDIFRRHSLVQVITDLNKLRPEELSIVINEMRAFKTFASAVSDLNQLRMNEAEIMNSAGAAHEAAAYAMGLESTKLDRLAQSWATWKRSVGQAVVNAGGVGLLEESAAGFGAFGKFQSGISGHQSLVEKLRAEGEFIKNAMISGNVPKEQLDQARGRFRNYETAIKANNRAMGFDPGFGMRGQNRIDDLLLTMGRFGFAGGLPSNMQGADDVNRATRVSDIRDKR